MKILYSLFLFGLLSSCKAKKPVEYGSLNGNIYWKYNNFVGNRPDAGSSIDIYSLTDSTFHEKATADIRGDYRFDSIPTGDYIAIIQSKNTTKSAKDNLMQVYLNSPYLERIFHVKFRDIFEAEYYKKIHAYDSLSIAALMGDASKKNLNELNASLKWHEAYKDSSNKVADSMINLIPREIRMQTGVYGNGSNSIKIESFKIDKNRTTSLITDFGITYF